MVHAPGVTDAMINLELFNVMDEFFRRTNAWRYAQDIELTEELDYPLAVPAGATIVRALGVTHKGFPLTPASTGGGGTDITVGGVGAITPRRSSLTATPSTSLT